MIEMIIVTSSVTVRCRMAIAILEQIIFGSWIGCGLARRRLFGFLRSFSLLEPFIIMSVALMQTRCKAHRAASHEIGLLWPPEKFARCIRAMLIFIFNYFCRLFSLVDGTYLPTYLFNLHLALS